MNNYYSIYTNFYEGNSPSELIAAYGSPLYVYNERILRQRCREMKELIAYSHFIPNYSTKANSNISLLKVIREEGLHVDAMSPGEIQILFAAGFRPDQIFYIGNNVSSEEMKYAIDREVLVSVDSISQLRQFGSINPGGRVAVRFNPGIGAGHHEKVITAGKKTKFGVNIDYISEVKKLLKEYDLKLIGINQHIGSLFMEGTPYLESVKSLLDAAQQFEGLEFVDLGGGFGVPYHKQAGQQRLELKDFGNKITQLLEEWCKRYGKEITFKIEPGRYIVAECGILLGTIYALKENDGVNYVGTDLGFNVLARPVMYDAYHDVEVYRKNSEDNNCMQATVVGNICETGDIIAKERFLPKVEEGDILGIMDAGAYGYVMSSNYNNRLRPAEVLIRDGGSVEIIRRRDKLEDLMRNFEV